MNRRTACLAVMLGPVLATARAWAQPSRPARVAWVSLERTTAESPFLASFRRGMRDAGWVEDRNLALTVWSGEGSGERLRKLVPEFVASRPDVVVAAGGAVTRPLIDAGVQAPMVFAFSGDVVIGKIVDSYAHPGNNRTGVSFFSLELVPKRLELMKEVLPGLKRVAVLGWPRHAGEPMELQAAASGAQKLGLAHEYHPVTSEAEVAAALDRIQRWRADAILAFADAITISHAERIAAFSIQHRIPAVSSWAVFAEQGNLLAYGPDLQHSYGRLSYFVDRILKGAKAGELPVEHPTSVELVINMRTARAIGVTIPPSVALRAARVIQ